MMLPGVEILTVDDIDWDLHVPCGDCPFRKSAPPHEGVAKSVAENVEAIEAHRFGHTCHKTDNRLQCDGPRNFAGRTKHCAGAILMLLKTGHGADLQLPLLEAMEDGKLDLAAMRHVLADVGDDVFTLRELAEFYAGFIARLLEDRRRDPHVCVVFDTHPDDPPTMIRLSEARAQNLDVLTCYTCGAPAVDYDGHWPYEISHNFCQDHADDGLRDAARDLAAIAKD